MMAKKGFNQTGERAVIYKRAAATLIGALFGSSC